MGPSASQVELASARVALSSATSRSSRVRTDGKFLRAADQRLLIKGVTYGTFAPDASGHQYPTRARIAQDFALMAAHGVNTVRTYTLPPPFLLDEAARHGLYVIAGMPWTQHVAFLSDKREARRVLDGIVQDVRRLGTHPAVLLVALGNEIPAGVVRWHGRDRIERFLGDAYAASKSCCPDALFTYVNFPPTGFLDLHFFDVAAFNVYLHRESDLRAYITRLQHLAGTRPLLLAELGADSIRQGEDGQAVLTSMQLETAFRAGACGAIAFAWTDEWWRGGFEVEDWDFGLVDRGRQPKPALAEVTRVFDEAPFSTQERAAWPRVSVVVCAYNAASTIDECLTSLAALDYPNYDVIVVNDGSSDGTGERARSHAIASVIDVPNGGLSVARNIGLGAATGEIVAYTDADVRVDPDWLTFLVQPFLNSDVVGSGGPNVVPPDDPWLAQCVARAPGGPTHVLLDDDIAEHVPGCNMAFRRSALSAVRGFNPIYQRAGDDVDVCWRLQAAGGEIGFAPAALVWHHHRTSVKAYWRQQVGYGEGEAWLAPHHPDKFSGGHASWHGRIYSPLPFVQALTEARINSGTWGLAAFPSVYQADSYPFAFMPHRFRWILGSTLMVAAGLALWWAGRVDLAMALVAVGALGMLTTVAKCVRFSLKSDLDGLPPIGALPVSVSRGVYRLTIAWLHFLQPLARAWGRVRGTLAGVERVPVEPVAQNHSISPVQILAAVQLVLGRTLERRYWGEQWTELGSWLSKVFEQLQSDRVGRGVEVDDGWQADRDLRVEVGRSCRLDIRGLLEDHGSGKRLARVGLRLRLTAFGWLAGAALAASVAGSMALTSTTRWPGVIVGVVAAAVLGRWLWQVAGTVAAAERAVTSGSEVCGLRPVS